MAYTETHKRLNAYARFMLKAFVKPMAVNGKPYKKIRRTAHQFLMTTEKYFNLEKTNSLGEVHFEQKETHSLGKLTAEEWSNYFY